MVLIRIKIFICLIFLSIAVQAQAIDPRVDDSLDKEWSIELPIWIPGFRGDFSYGNINIEGEDGGNPPPPTPENPIEPGEGLGGNILSRLFSKDSFFKFFYMGKFSYTPKRFLFQSDGFGGSAGSAIRFNFNNKEIVSASYNFLILNFYAGWSLFQKIDYEESKKTNIYFYTGFRYARAIINAELNRRETKFEIDPGWVEVLLDINAKYTIKDWKFNIKADLGGLTSKSAVLSYKIQLLAYYYIGRTTALRFGWTDMDLKHSNLFRNELLILHTHLSGPNLGIAFYL